MNFPKNLKLSFFIFFLIGIGSLSCDLDEIEEVSAPIPRFNITSSSTPCELPCQVNVDGSDSEHTTSYSWDFGDGSAPKSGSSSSHTYDSTGTFTITLIATGPGGSKEASNTQQVFEATSGPNPATLAASFSFDSLSNNGFAPSTVWFLNTSTGADTYEWDFGDPTSPDNTSTEPNPSHTYQSSGIFTITLKAINSTSGTEDSFSKDTIIARSQTFLRTFSGSTVSSREMPSLAQLSSDGYVILTLKEIAEGFVWSNFLIFTDNMGEKLGDATINSNLFDNGSAIIEKRDGDIAFVGSTGDDHIHAESYLFVTDGVGGNSQKTLIGNVPEFDAARDIIQHPTGSIGILGHSGNEFVFSLTDNSGTLLPGTPQRIAAGGEARGNAVTLNSDGGFALAGSVTTSEQQIALVLTDQNGIPFQGYPKLTPIGGGREGQAHSVIRLQEEGYALVGTATGGSFDQAFLHLTDENGNALAGFPRLLSLPDGMVEDLRAIVQLPNGNLAMVGTGRKITSSDRDIVLLLTDAEGDFFPGSINYYDIEEIGLDDHGYDLILTSDGGLAFVGAYSNHSDVVLIKTDNLGNVE